MSENEENRIKKLRERLYGKNFKDESQQIGEFKEKQYRVKEQWMSEEPPMSPSKKIKLTKRRMNIKKVLIASIVFFIISIAVAFFIIQNGSNIFSLKKVDINVNGPISVNGGEKFVLDLKITNNNETAMDVADLITQYPKGSYLSFDSQKELTRTREALGKIEPNQTVEKKMSLVLFGSGNTKKEIDFTLETRFAGSSATLDKTKKYEITIASSPVNLSVGIPEKIGTKQGFEIIVNLDSNSNNVLNNLMMKVGYPTGFTFSSASPSPTSGKDIWKIGDMSPTDKRIIKIRGTIEGQADEAKNFTVAVGSRDPQNEDSIGTVYNSASQQIVITKPFLGLRVLVNGTDAPEYVTKSSRALRFDVLWNSNSSIKTTNVNLSAKLDGNIVDRFSVSPDKGGFYQSSNNTIIWGDRTGKNDLSVIEPGESGKVSFTLQSLPLVDREGNVFKNPEINITVKADGNQATETGAMSKLSSSVSKNIKIDSQLRIVPRAVYYTGPFKNTGPLPPQVNTGTTYTVVLSITNTSNKISSAVVKTTLPTYVKWLGVVSPSNEDISFDNLDGQIVWNAGDIPAGTGFVNGAKEVAFKVEFTPSVSQVSRTPLLTGGITISGKDTFTGTLLNDREKGININLSSDPSFSITQASVVTQK